jgi:hypothetical protein
MVLTFSIFDRDTVAFVGRHSKNRVSAVRQRCLRVDGLKTLPGRSSIDESHDAPILLANNEDDAAV